VIGAVKCHIHLELRMQWFWHCRGEHYTNWNMLAMLPMVLLPALGARRCRVDNGGEPPRSKP
jgi:hypothetical protein